jgi:chromosome segregation ATPase
MKNLHTTPWERAEIIKCPGRQFGRRDLAEDVNTLVDEIIRMREEFRCSAVQQNSRMEAAERELYLKLDEVEQERDKLREDLAIARNDTGDMYTRATQLAEANTQLREELEKARSCIEGFRGLLVQNGSVVVEGLYITCAEKLLSAYDESNGLAGHDDK